MKLNRLALSLMVILSGTPFISSAATLVANDDTNTISGLDSSQMLSDDNGERWIAYTDEKQNDFPGNKTVVVAVKDTKAINSEMYDPALSYPTTGTMVRYNGYYWTSKWWVNPGEVPGSNDVWQNAGEIKIQELGTFKFTPYTGQAAIDFQKKQKDALAAQRKVAGYFPEWGVYDAHNNFTPDKIDYSTLTQINYGFAVVKNGQVVMHDTEQGPRLIRELNDRTAAAGVRHVISIGGWNNSEEGAFEAATATPQGIETLAKSMVDYMLEWEFDGIDVDWEYPDADNEKEAFTKLIQSVRSKLDEQGMKDDTYYSLSAAVTTNHNKIAYTNPAVTAPLLDNVNVMAYDFHGAFEPVTGHNAPLYANTQDQDQLFNVDSAMKEYVNTWKVPKSKLLMGIPYYGRGWGDVDPIQVVNGLPGLFAPGSATVHGTWDDDGQNTGTHPWYVLKEKAASEEYGRYWDTESKVPYLYSLEKKEFLTYDDPESIRNKVDYINREGYGGAIVWDISGDTPDHELGKIVQDAFKTLTPVKEFKIVIPPAYNGPSIQVLLSKEDQTTKKFVVFVNGNYAGHTENGTVYYGSKQAKGDDVEVLLHWGLKAGDVVDIQQDDKINPPVVLEKFTVTQDMLKFPEATKAQKQAVKLFVDKNDDNAVKLTLSNEDQRNRKFVVWKNNVYLGHTDRGSVYYGKKVVEGRNTTAIFRTALKAGDVLEVREENGVSAQVRFDMFTVTQEMLK
ncbi:glycosyl hydrolase family 18 protein [Chimaeribacter arupi]|uniref:glycosyl hydrolase family 18 protein n=1 Tax=Chimaeribacter arupi TaxID=2060066 RepID=UPI000C7CE527|nr:glycosyl hydrolase family 18 protein [Chimaeribacter arupi]PLR37695.1 polysaccharide degrading enzyme [Chimaeribacter arupi]